MVLGSTQLLIETSTIIFLRVPGGRPERNEVRSALRVSFPKATRGLEPTSISYREALLSTLLHATVYVYAQFAECTGTDCK
jgi:hypothetical protein